MKIYYYWTRLLTDKNVFLDKWSKAVSFELSSLHFSNENYVLKIILFKIYLFLFKSWSLKCFWIRKFCSMAKIIIKLALTSFSFKAKPYLIWNFPHEKHLSPMIRATPLINLYLNFHHEFEVFWQTFLWLSIAPTLYLAHIPIFSF